jgi:hypothetical protein
VRQADEVIAVLCSDLHLSHKPPLLRSVEKCWYDAMARQLEQLTALATEHNCPVVCAGDIFDRWNSPPELVNFALRHLPRMYAVPGQHDLPHHSYEDRHKSAYWTLVEAGKVEDLPPDLPIHVDNGLCLWGFPWGHDLAPLSKECWGKSMWHIAVIHKYLWIKGTNYPGAPTENRLKNLWPLLNGFDVALFGDNHIHFSSENLPNKGRRPFIWNNGSFMRRKADEVVSAPCVGLLRADGSVKPHFLDVSEDKFLEPDALAEVMAGAGFESFVQELSDLGGAAVDFADAVRRTLARDKVPEAVKKVILTALEGKQ